MAPLRLEQGLGGGCGQVAYALPLRGVHWLQGAVLAVEEGLAHSLVQFDLLGMPFCF